MKREITINNQKIEYILNTGGRKAIKLTIACDGEVSVFAPKNTPIDVIDNFVAEKTEWILDRIEFFKKQNLKIIKLNKNDFEKYKESALALVENRINHFNSIYNYEINRIFIKDLKSRWGSCSGKGNLNFNYRLVLLNPKLSDYIIIHELCHLKELNHSKDFWNLVSKTFPEYNKARKELRKIHFDN